MAWVLHGLKSQQYNGLDVRLTSPIEEDGRLSVYQSDLKKQMRVFPKNLLSHTIDALWNLCVANKAPPSVRKSVQHLMNCDAESSIQAALASSSELGGDELWNCLCAAEISLHLMLPALTLGPCYRAASFPIAMHASHLQALFLQV